MIEITLTEFVDFVIKSGRPKLTVVRNAKNRHQEGYDPKTDFWKKLRDGIVEVHSTGQPTSTLDRLIAGPLDRNKERAYPEALAGYRRFVGSKQLEWFKPLKRSWESSGLLVRVNPELGLKINGTPHLIKLYFKADKLTKIRVDTILHLMQIVATQQQRRSPATLGILDVRSGKLIKASDFDPDMTPLLEGEASSFATMYPRV